MSVKPPALAWVCICSNRILGTVINKSPLLPSSVYAFTSSFIHPANL